MMRMASSWSTATTGLLVVFSSSLLVGTVLAVDKPFMYPEPMSKIDSYRHNVCNQSYLFNMGQVPLRDALNGLSLTPILNLDRFIQMSNETGGIDDEKPGLEIKIMDELAR